MSATCRQCKTAFNFQLDTHLRNFATKYLDAQQVGNTWRKFRRCTTRKANRNNRLHIPSSISSDLAKETQDQRICRETRA